MYESTFIPHHISCKIKMRTNEQYRVTERRMPCVFLLYPKYRNAAPSWDDVEQETTASKQMG